MASKEESGRVAVVVELVVSRHAPAACWFCDNIYEGQDGCASACGPNHCPTCGAPRHRPLNGRDAGTEVN